MGLGEPVFDRLDADIAHSLMSINAIKGVEIGDGFDVVEQRGSEHRDEMTPQGFKTNHAGGILGEFLLVKILWRTLPLNRLQVSPYRVRLSRNKAKALR